MKRFANGKILNEDEEHAYTPSQRINICFIIENHQKNNLYRFISILNTILKVIEKWIANGWWTI